MTIALIDCNSFFASCEIAFRPDIEHQPVVVLSNNDGCVVARNQYAKALNIPMGYPYFKIEKYLNQYGVHVFSSNYQLYTDMSDRMNSILRDCAPTVETYSIDEAFIDLSDIPQLKLAEHSYHIQARLFRELHLPVSIGIAPTKVLSKIANHLAKKYPQTHGIVDLSDTVRQDRALALIPIEKIWGIRSGRSKRLNALGIRNALELRDYKNTKLIYDVLTKPGAIIQEELKGTSILKVETTHSAKKSIMASRSFTPAITNEASLKQAIARFTTIAVEKLRKQESKAQGLYVSIRTNRHISLKSYRGYDAHLLQAPSSDTRLFIDIALNILARIYQPGFYYKKIAVGLSHIWPTTTQLDLFHPGDSAQSEQLMHTMDHINHKYGPETLKSAALSTAPLWKTQMNFRSPQYTTNWNEILHVKI